MTESLSAVDTAENAEIAEAAEEAALPETEAAEAAEAAVEAVPEAETIPEPNNRRKRRKIYEVTPENDMKFRGLLSYRHIKALAWLFIVFAQIVTIAEIKTDLKLKPINNEYILGIMSSLSSLAMPMLLISALSVLINGKDSYQKMLIKNGAITIGFFLAFLLLYERYVLGVLSLFFDGRDEAADYAKMMITAGKQNVDIGFFTFNIFLDIFLCTLVMFFINYNPKKYFQGKKIYIFRSMVIIPILYEVGNVVIKTLAATHKIDLPLIFSPFLTTKPPLVFFMFMAMARFIKRRERNFIKHGKTHEDYQEFLKTNTNSFQFSKFMIIIIFIFAVIDFFLYFVFVLMLLPDVNNATAEEIEMDSIIIQNIGIGETINMLGLIPFMLGYSYTKLHKHPVIDIAIPIVGVCAIVCVYFDSIFVIIRDLFSNISH
ncbi:MAG: hypothetical protein IKO44_02360 [Ruminococcus sp.]|nr:hypothetical protein [Ruminococcus sp.]